MIAAVFHGTILPPSSRKVEELLIGTNENERRTKEEARGKGFISMRTGNHAFSEVLATAGDACKLTPPRTMEAGQASLANGAQ